MATRLLMLCAGATASARTGAFPHPDEPLDDAGVRKARAAVVPRHALALVAPGRAASDTAGTMAITGDTDPALTDVDRGAWAGRSLSAVHTTEPERLAAWFADPTLATPEGESMAEVASRVSRWLGRIAVQDRAVLAITYPGIVRAAIGVALAIPPAATLAIDVAPLSVATLSFNGRWRLQGLGRAVAECGGEA